MNKQILLILSGIAFFATSSAFAMDIYNQPNTPAAPIRKHIRVHVDEPLTLDQLEALPRNNYETCTPIYTYKVIDTAVFDRDLKALKAPIDENVDGVLYDFMTCKRTTVGGTDEGHYDEVTYTYTLKNPRLPGSSYLNAKTRDNKDITTMVFNPKITVTFKKQK